MDANRLLALLAKRKSGELSLPDQKELLDFLNDNPDYERISDSLDHVFDSPFNVCDDVDDQYIQNRWKSFEKKLSNRPAVNLKPKKWINAMLVAASLLFFILLGTFIFNNKTTGDKQNIVSTKKGSKTKLILPDGSLVWLNAESRLSYNEGFSKNTREVTLVGEAYFDVVKDPSLPFIVHTPVLNVKVLGTAFNVKAYQDEKSTETTLIRGSVEVTLIKDVTKKIVLKPNEKLSVQNNYLAKNTVNSTDDSHINQITKPNGNPYITISEIKLPLHDSVAVETQWVKNRLAFSNEKLEDIVLQLSRWYGINIEINSDELKSKQYSGIFEDESLEQIIEALQLTGGFHYNIDKKKITIFP